MSRIHYAIEIVLSADQTPADYAPIGLKSEAFSWVQPDPAFDSDARCFANIGTTLFVGCAAGHVYKSTDNGATWTECSTGLPGYDVKAFAVIDTNIFAGLTSGVYLSTDMGAHWSAVNTGLPDLPVWTLCSKGTELFVGLNSDIYKSTNNGTSWVYTGIGIFGGTINSVMAHGTDIWAGGYTYGPYVSTDDGVTWTPKYTGIYGLDLKVTAFVFSGGNIFAATTQASGPYPYGVFLSTDGGTNWNTCNAGLTNLVVNDLIMVEGVLYAATNGGIWKSLDNGISWTQSASFDYPAVAQALFYFNGSIYAGTSATVYKMRSGNSAFRYITDRPQYDGSTVVPIWGAHERLYAEDAPQITSVWYEGFLTKEAIISNPSRSIDISMGGNYGNQGGLSFAIRADVSLISYCQTNGIYLINQRVNFYVVIDDVFYQQGTYVVSNNPLVDESSLQFVCQDDSQTVHTNIPPNIITPLAYPTSTNQSDAIPVCIGDVPHAELKNIDNLATDLNGDLTNSIFMSLVGGKSYLQTAIVLYDDGYTSGVIGGKTWATTGKIFAKIINMGVSFIANDPRLVGSYLVERGSSNGKICKITSNEATAGGLFTDIYLNDKLPYDWTTFTQTDVAGGVYQQSGAGYTYVWNANHTPIVQADIFALTGPQKDTKWFEIFPLSVDYKYSQIEDKTGTAGATIIVGSDGYPLIETYQSLAINSTNNQPNVKQGEYNSIGELVDLSASTDKFKFLTNGVNENGSINSYKNFDVSGIPYDSHVYNSPPSPEQPGNIPSTQALPAAMTNGFRNYYSSSSNPVVSSGSLVFILNPAPAELILNSFVLMVNLATNAYMIGTVSSYGGGSLAVSITSSYGSGASTNTWLIYIGIPFTAGPPNDQQMIYLWFDINASRITDLTYDKYYAVLDLLFSNGSGGLQTSEIEYAIQSPDVYGNYGPVPVTYALISSSTPTAQKQTTALYDNHNLIPNLIYDLIGGFYGITDPITLPLAGALSSDVNCDLLKTDDLSDDLTTALKTSGAARICFRLNFGTHSPTDVDTFVLKQFAVIGVKSINTIQGKMYAEVDGEKCGYNPDGTVNPNSSVINPCTGLPTLTPTNDVYHAFMHLLEDYDHIQDKTALPVDYGNLSTKRVGVSGSENWWLGRQLTDQQTSLQYYIDLCKQSFVALWSNRLGGKSLSAYIEQTTDNIVMALSQDDVIRDSIKNWQQTDVTTLFNEFTLNYSYNPGASAWDKNYTVANVDKASFPAYDIPTGLWTQYCSGPGLSYADAAALWTICHNVWLVNHNVQLADSSLTNCYWYIDESVFYTTTNPCTGVVAPTYIDTAKFYFAKLMAWTTKQKNIVEFALPLTALNVTLDVMSPLTWSDIIYTGAEAEFGWITKIEIDVRNDQILLSLILLPLL